MKVDSRARAYLDCAQVIFQIRHLEYSKGLSDEAIFELLSTRHMDRAEARLSIISPLLE